MLDCNHNSGPAVLRTHSDVVMQAKAALLALLPLPSEDGAGRGAPVLKGLFPFMEAVSVCVCVSVQGVFTPAKHRVTTASSCASDSTYSVDVCVCFITIWSELQLSVFFTLTRVRN